MTIEEFFYKYGEDITHDDMNEEAKKDYKSVCQIMKNRSDEAGKRFNQELSMCESTLEEELYKKLHIALFNTDIKIEQQKKMFGYRVDFYLFNKNKSLIVECDGYNFHERTIDQAERDRKRDRILSKNGYTVFRIMSTEIFNAHNGKYITDILDYFERKEVINVHKTL